MAFAPLVLLSNVWHGFVSRVQYMASNEASAGKVTAFFLIGLFVSSWPLVKLLAVGISLSLPGQPLTKWGAKKGAYAVVTGSTGEIGVEWVRQMAKAGLNILLVSRNAAKLEEQALQARKESGMDVQWHAIDFAHGSKEDWAALGEFLVRFDIGVLVNNSGLAENVADDFVDQPTDEQLNICRVNCESLAHITKLVAPMMVKKRRGLILNNSSFTGYVPAPGVSLYSASKAWLFSFSASLGHELAKHNVQVFALCTHFCSTSINGSMPESFLVTNARVYVRNVLSRLGRRGGAVFGMPHMVDLHPSHALELWYSSLSPWWIIMRAEEYIFKDMTASARKRGTRPPAEVKKQK